LEIFLPFVILLNFVIFISTNTGISSSSFLVFNVGRKIRAPSLFDSSLSNTVQNAWEAGAWVMAIVTATFRGFWPYLILMSMLVFFCLPTSILSHKNREKFLIILQSLAKFNTLKIYSLIMMLIAFHLHIDLPVIEQSRATEGSIADIYTRCAYSTTSLIIGTIISLILSHIIIHLHRGLYSHLDENKGENAENHKSIMSIAKAKYMRDIPFRIIISCILFLTLGFMIAGSFTYGFTFYFQGLAGYGLKLLKIPHYREFTLIGMGKSLPSVYENPTDPTIILVEVTYLLIVFVFPLAFLFVFGILWFVPMTRKIQKFLYTIAEILNAWSGMEALVIIYVPSFLENELVSKFMIGDKCDTINPILETYFSKFLEGNNTCLEIQTVLEKGFWLFLVATVFFVILSFVLLKICRNALNERLPEHVKEFLKIKKEERIV